MYTYCICLTWAYDEILCINKIRRRYQKQFKVHFSVWNWRLSQTLCSQLVTEKSKQYQTLCKDFTEIANQKKSRESTHPKFQKKKSFLYKQFLIE